MHNCGSGAAHPTVHEQETMKVRHHQVVWSVLALAICGLSVYVAGAETETPLQYAAAEEIAKLSVKGLSESSGLAPSRLDTNLLWTHNDSGDSARLFAVDISGATAGVCDVNGADAIDWEDMASYSKEGKPYLLVADTGDNGRKRKKYQLYRIPERHPDQAPLAVDQTVHFKFDKGPCDCEAIAYDATLDQVILIDKGWSLRCRVFTLDWPVKATKKTQLAKQVAVLKIAGITGMDISPDGRRAIVLTYGPAYEFVRDADETWKRAFARPGREIRMPVRRQGEAICYGADGKMLFVTSEKLPTPLFRLAVVDEPTTAESAPPKSPVP
jgi:hypothetical protein